MSDVRKLLQSQPLTAGLNTRQLDFLSSVCKEVRFAPGEVIFREDDPAQTFYLILEGRVILEIARGQAVPVEIQTLEAGDPVGLSWLYEPYRWVLTATAERATKALQFDAVAVRTECAVNHELGYRFYGRLLELVGRRLQATRLALLEQRSDY